jgi:hypothetical protein
MKYLCLVYLAPDVWSACPDSTCASYAQTLTDNGKLIGGQPLHPTHTATTVRVRNGAVSVTDGPFAETKEVLGGFAVVDVADEQAARLWAGKIATACGWPQEVRRFQVRRQPPETS